jgi:acyl-CoA synthetase (AMP-forming)/AMP-acid ligase II
LRDGWLFTGDIGTMDAEGYFTIVDRRKDMILVSGFNVYPNEVEAVLAGLAGVKDCVVIGVPDAASGEAVKAFIVRGDPALDAKTVRDFCKCELASYKVPRLVEFRDNLPKSNIGKVLRKDLRQNPPSHPPSSTARYLCMSAGARNGGSNPYRCGGSPALTLKECSKMAPPKMPISAP